MKKVDYNQNQYKNYQQGRAHSAETIRLWMEALAKYLPRLSEYTILDLGSGTGRYAPHLADYFHACVVGVEPSDKMREIAVDSNTNPRISYIEGKAEEIPVDD